MRFNWKYESKVIISRPERIYCMTISTVIWAFFIGKTSFSSNNEINLHCNWHWYNEYFVDLTPDILSHLVKSIGRYSNCSVATWIIIVLWPGGFTNCKSCLKLCRCLGWSFGIVGVGLNGGSYAWSYQLSVLSLDPGSKMQPVTSVW